MPQPADGPARRRDGDAHDARPAAMDRAASDAGQAHNLDPTHPAHPRHALYQGCAAGVDALDRQLGRAPDERSACMKIGRASWRGRGWTYVEMPVVGAALKKHSTHHTKDT